MNIPYAIRSSFTAPCEQNIAAQQEALESEQAITFHLPETKSLSGSRVRGYSHRLTVKIDPADATHFQMERAPQRFPARIKAAATALRHCGNTGTFIIAHDSGMLSIKRA